jgi:hypothetical protein
MESFVENLEPFPIPRHEFFESPIRQLHFWLAHPDGMRRPVSSGMR